MTSHLSKTTTDHDEIRRWAEARGGKPACVKGTGSRGDTGMIRLDFPGYSGAASLQPISWDEWFQQFDDNNLALVYQEKTASGERSNFNKLIGRETGGARSHGVSHASRHHGKGSSASRSRSSRSTSGSRSSSRSGSTRSTSRSAGSRSGSSHSARSHSSSSHSGRSHSASSRAGSSHSGGRRSGRSSSSSPGGRSSSSSRRSSR